MKKIILFSLLLATLPAMANYGGGAPISGGLFVLLGLAAGYGVAKGIKHFKNNKEELEE